MSWTIILFILFGGLAVGCAVALVAQRNPLYSAISLVGVFIALACLYVTLAAPFIAAVQIIVYAGAIMVLVIFVIMLLNVEEEARRPISRPYLIAVGVLLGAVLIAQTVFMLALRGGGRADAPAGPSPTVGLTKSVGTGLFTEYLLPFEITSVLILMALVGAITLARRDEGTGMEAAVDEAGSPLPAGTARAPLAAGAVRPGLTQETGREAAADRIERTGAAAGDPERGRKE